MPGRDKSVDPAILSSELRTARVSAWIGVALLIAAVGYVTIAFAPIADPVLLAGWSGAFGLLFLVWIATLVAIERRNPSDAEIVRAWVPLLRGVAITSNLLVAASVWLLLPAAGPELRAFMTVMYVWYILIHSMAETRASRAGNPATLLVLGSLAAFELVYRHAYSVPMAVFLMVFALTMVAFRRLIRRALLETIHAKVVADETGAALNKALVEVAAQRDAVTRFLASASHDLQQPVQAASLFFDQAIGVGESGARRRAVEGARQAFASAQALLQDMLEHLRQESGIAEVRSEPIALHALVKQVALQNEALARISGVAIRTAGTSLGAQADPRLLQRILGNLVANALTHAGGSKLLIGARPRGERVLLYVIDDGRGISETAEASIFDEFNMAHGQRKAGFGLGLATSRRFARAMGAELALERRWTRGACFVVSLPRCTLPVTCAFRPEPAPEAPCEAA